MIKSLLYLRKIYDYSLSLLLILISIAVLVLLAPQIFGIKVYAVISGSMEPALHIGSLALVKQASPENITAGDIIAFKMTDNSTVVTHRVADINNEKETFITKGDANSSSDGPVKFDKLVGKMVFSIPYLGFPAVYIKTRAGIVITAGFLIVTMLFIFIPESLHKQKS